VNIANDAKWTGVSAGSDTVLISKTNYVIGDTFFVTISCINECTYDIK